MIDLVDAGTDVNAQGGPFGNVLLAAIEHAHPNTVLMLLERGADARATREKGDALAAARESRNDEIIKLVNEACQSQPNP